MRPAIKHFWFIFRFLWALLYFLAFFVTVVYTFAFLFSGVANAETGKLWYNAHTGNRFSFSSPAAACAYIGTVPGRSLGKDRGKCWKEGENGFRGFEMSEYYAEEKTCEVESILNNGSSDGVDLSGSWKTLHWMRAPKGKDAGKWYPDSFTQCENNCTVRYKVFNFVDGNPVVNEKDGTSRKGFTKYQTGGVCAPPPPDDNKDPEPPKSDTDDDGKPDDNKPGDGGRDDSSAGEGEGGSSGEGKGDREDDPKQPDDGGRDSDGIGDGGDEGGGESDGDGKGGPQGGGSGDGSGKDGDEGGGGSQWLLCPSHRGYYKRGTEPTGDCALTPPKPKDPKKPGDPKQPEDPKKPDPKKPDEPNQPKDPKKPDEPNQPDPKKPGGGSGGGGGGGGGGSPGQSGHDGKGADGKDGGNGTPGGNPGGGTGGMGGNVGNPGGNTNPGGGTGGNGSSADGDGKHDGKDDKGEGSGISGGDCKTGRAPVCKGDQVQCYIAREQWRTSCLAESGRTDLGAKGDCKTGKKPVCRGDATTCYQLQLQFEQTCAATGGGEGDLDGAKEGFGDSIGEREIADETGLGKAPTTDDIKNQFGKEVDVASYANKFDDRGFLNNHACMAPQKYTVSGISFTIDWSMLCLFLTYVGYFVVAVGYFIGFRIVSGGFD